MRLNTISVKLTALALFAGGVAMAATGRAWAGSPSPMAPQAAARMDTENDIQYVEHLRAERKSLALVKDSLSKEDMADRAGHRKEALDAIDKALEAMNSEISAYDKDMKTGK